MVLLMVLARFVERPPPPKAPDATLPQQHLDSSCENLTSERAKFVIANPSDIYSLVNSGNLFNGEEIRDEIAAKLCTPA